MRNRETHISCYPWAAGCQQGGRQGVSRAGTLAVAIAPSARLRNEMRALTLSRLRQRIQLVTLLLFLVTSRRPLLSHVTPHHPPS